MRSYTCGVIDNNNENIYVGSSVGEVCIFNIMNKIFKAAIPVSTNWVLSINLIENNILLVGSGDGKLKKLIKNNKNEYQAVNEVQLDGAVTSINHLSEIKELVVGTNSGKVYRSNYNNLQSSVYCEGSLG
jgi:hypothetical protein